MHKTVHKLFWVWDYQKEEDWLNGMCAQGWTLIAVGFGVYHFESCRPNQYQYRLELREQMSDPAYVAFLEEMGAEQIGRLFRWHYFRKDASTGPFELFSDTTGRVRHLNGILLLLSIPCIVNLLFGAVNLGLLLLDRSGAHTLSLGISLLNFLLGFLLLLGFLRVWRIRRAVKRAGALFE